MCGIFGLARVDGPLTAADTQRVRQGLRLLEHRGPDGEGVAARDGVCLGHRRLSIIDLAGGAQPMASRDQAGSIAYNGEVYNFHALRDELERAGRRFSTRSDTEVVLNAVLAWGPDALSRLRGMFAFAAVDSERRILLLARDRLGIKPLYYARTAEGLLWSSELEPLYRAAGPFDLDLEALDDYLQWQYVPAPRTIYRGIRCLPPAHHLTLDLQSGAVVERRYWDLRFREDRALTAEEWGARLDAKIREAVQGQLVSDVPFGAFLSGGIDSSLVVGYMAEIMDRPVQTFSIGFHESDASELPYAGAVARANRTDHHSEIVEPDSLGLLPRLALHYGQPFADSSAIPTYYVARMARRHVKMVLSGDGGDEGFAGYHSYETVHRRLQAAAGRGVRGRIRALAARFYRRACVREETVERAYGLHCLTAKHFGPEERRQLLVPALRGIVRDRHPERRALMDLAGAPIISRLQHLDLMTYLPFDVLTKVDIASMANSLEVRVPLLDHELVELAATMPCELKLRPLLRDGQPAYEQKHALRQLARRRYPADVVDRPKMGFGLPIGQWMRGALRSGVEARLLRSTRLSLLVERSQVAALWERHLAGQDSTPLLWNLLVLDAWMESHPEACNRVGAGARPAARAGVT